MAEPDASGSQLWVGGISSGPLWGGAQENIKGLGPKQDVSTQVDVTVPGIKEMAASIQSLTKSVDSLKQGMSSLLPTLKEVAKGYKEVRQEADSASVSMSKGPNKASVPDPTGKSQTVWSGPSESKWWNAATNLVGTVEATRRAYRTAPPGGSGDGSGDGGSSADVAAAGGMGRNVSGAMDTFMKGITGQNGIMGFLMSGLAGAAQLYGAVSGTGIQYAYNRINGPSGNQNATLGMAQMLGPNAGMMGMPIQDVIRGLAQRTPVLGTTSDIAGTILAGQSVGALMSGTENRNGFFESVRQGQILTPGVGAGQIASSVAGYIGNTKSQQMGQFLGEGAFTMIGQGGRYKSLSEWAAGITKFFQQQRPGGQQGKSFTKDELLAQNFPGSNINAWFQMMGVPQDMVDYWWQYALSTGGDTSAVTTDTLKKMVDKTRGIDLGYERLRNETQGSRREYLMSNNMYGMYALRESADRRFNVAMQGTDNALAQMLKTTNLGSMMSLLPTPIIEMLMPILTNFATSPLGAGAAAIGGIMGMGDPSEAPVGDPIGDTGYGSRGATSTSHMSPDLSKRVQAMMKANPRLKISSGYRDTVTQNRLSKQGYKVGGSKASHARGWAVDIGPRSELGWVAQNAGKFGLQTASKYGEPWHVQLGGTMPVGDPQGSEYPIGVPGISDIPVVGGVVDGFVGGAKDFLMGGVEDIAKGFFSVLSKMLSGLMNMAMSPITNFVKEFVGGGGFSGMVDTATSMYSRITTAPLMGLANLFGKNDMTGQEDVSSLINQKANISLPIVTFEGFQPSNTNLGPQVFDTGDPIGDPDISGMLTPGSGVYQGSGGRTIVFKTDVHLTAGNLGNTGEARRTASVLADHLEEEFASRGWRGK